MVDIFVLCIVWYRGSSRRYLANNGSKIYGISVLYCIAGAGRGRAWRCGDTKLMEMRFDKIYVIHIQVNRAVASVSASECECECV